MDKETYMSSIPGLARRSFLLVAAMSILLLAPSPGPAQDCSDCLSIEVETYVPDGPSAGFASGFAKSRLYVTGGTIGGNSPTTTHRTYEPGGAWDSSLAPWPLSDPPNSTTYLAYAVAGNRYFVFAGGYVPHDQSWEYLIDTDEWVSRAPMPGGLRSYQVQAAVLDGKIYVAGNHPVTVAPPDSAIRYDPISDTWTELAPMLTPRFSHALAACEGHVYAIGGLWGGYPHYALTEVERYDPDSDSWESVAPLPYPLTYMTAASYGGHLYVFGGHESPYGADLYHDEIFRYDPSLDEWCQVGTLPKPLAYNSIAQDGPDIYLIAGANGHGLYTDEVLRVSFPGDQVCVEDDGYGVSLLAAGPYDPDADTTTYVYQVCRGTGDSVGGSPCPEPPQALSNFRIDLPDCIGSDEVDLTWDDGFAKCEIVDQDKFGGANRCEAPVGGEVVKCEALGGKTFECGTVTLVLEGDRPKGPGGIGTKSGKSCISAPLGGPTCDGCQ